MLFTISGDVYDSRQMQNWEPTQAQLKKAGYETHSGDDSNTYEAYANYVYVFRGQEYSNDRVSIAGGADNIGDYQTDLGRSLSSALSRGGRLEIYVIPRDPRD